MKGLFCGGCKARNNEEYRIVLKKRQKRMLHIDWCFPAQLRNCKEVLCKADVAAEEIEL
ncbi:MAG: hypothetical protein IJX66_08745 [Lachnospiraceae bacterium]|nr:hypothetical protein [Lachnospiraceae bacterium]